MPTVFHRLQGLDEPDSVWGSEHSSAARLLTPINDSAQHFRSDRYTSLATATHDMLMSSRNPEYGRIYQALELLHKNDQRYEPSDITAMLRTLKTQQYYERASGHQVCLYSDLSTSPSLNTAVLY